MGAAQNETERTFFLRKAIHQMIQSLPDDTSDGLPLFH